MGLFDGNIDTGSAISWIGEHSGGGGGGGDEEKKKKPIGGKAYDVHNSENNGGGGGGGDDHHDHGGYQRPEVPVYNAPEEHHEEHAPKKEAPPVYTAPETPAEATESITEVKQEQKPAQEETVILTDTSSGTKTAATDASSTKAALTEEEEKEPEWMTYGAGTGRRSGEERADRAMAGYKPKPAAQPTAGNMTAPDHFTKDAANLESQWFNTPKPVPTTGGGAVYNPEKVEAPKADIDRALAYNEDMRRQQALARANEMARQLNGSIAAANAARYVPPTNNGYVPANYLRENPGASYNPVPTTNGYVPTSGLREADAAAEREAAERAAQAESSIRYRDQMAALQEANAEDQRRADALARANATAGEREAAVAGSIQAAQEAAAAAEAERAGGLQEGPIYVPTVTPEDAIQWNAEHEQGWNDAYAAADAEEQAQADRDKWVQDKAQEIFLQMQGETAVPGSVAAADEARQAQRESDAAFYTGIQEPTEYPLGSYENPIKRPMAQVRAEGQKRFNDALAAGKILTADGKVDTGGYAWDGSRTPVTRREGSGNSTLDLDTVMAEYDAGRSTPQPVGTVGRNADVGTVRGAETSGSSAGTTGTTGTTGSGTGTGTGDKVPKGSQYFRPSYGQDMEKGVKAPYRREGYSIEDLEGMGNAPRTDFKYNNGKPAYEGYYLAPNGQYYPVDQQKAEYYKRYGTYNGWQEGMRDYWNTFGTFYGYRPGWQNGRGGGGRRYYRGGGGGSYYSGGGGGGSSSGNNSGGIYWNANTSWSI